MSKRDLSKPFSALTLAVTAAAACLGAEADVEWRHHGGDKTSARYSPLSQIDAENFSQLEVAWRWESADKHVDAVSPYDRQPFRSTPLMIGGRIYVPTELSQVAALGRQYIVVAGGGVREKAELVAYALP